MAEVVVAPRAEAELRAIWLAIARENPPAADRVLLAIDEKISRLKEYPDLGVRRNDISQGARILIEGNYLLLYEHRKDQDVVDIISIIDGRRELRDWR